MQETLYNNDITTIKEHSKFESLQEFNSSFWAFVERFQDKFTQSELLALHQLKNMAYKTPGVAFGKISTIVSSTWYKGKQGISTSTFTRMLRKARNLGILETIKTARKKKGGQANNVYIFNIFEENETIDQSESKQLTNLSNAENIVKSMVQAPKIDAESLFSFNLLKDLRSLSIKSNSQNKVNSAPARNSKTDSRNQEVYYLAFKKTGNDNFAHILAKHEQRLSNKDVLDLISVFNTYQDNNNISMDQLINYTQTAAIEGHNKGGFLREVCKRHVTGFEYDPNENEWVNEQNIFTGFKVDRFDQRLKDTLAYIVKESKHRVSHFLNGQLKKYISVGYDYSESLAALGAERSKLIDRVEKTLCKEEGVAYTKYIAYKFTV